MQEKPVKCYSGEEAKRIFQQAWKEGSVILTKHCRERMKERDIDNNDLIMLARLGAVFDPPEIDIKTGEWKYTIERRKPLLKAVFTVLSGNKIRLLTAEN